MFFASPMDPADRGKSPEETKHKQGREHIYELFGPGASVTMNLQILL
jgi:hypothetical protein